MRTYQRISCAAKDRYGPAQLEVLALDLIEDEAFVLSGLWGCLGLKRLSIAFLPLGPSNAANEVAPESSRATWILMCWHPQRPSG